MRAMPEQGGCRCGNSSSTRVAAATVVATAGMVAAVAAATAMVAVAAASNEHEQVQGCSGGYKGCMEGHECSTR